VAKSLAGNFASEPPGWNGPAASKEPAFRVRVGVSCIFPFVGAIPGLSVLLITEEKPRESRQCGVAALNAKRGDRASVVVTKLVPRLRRTFADWFGWLFVS
jgi:hypothetical protein